MNKTFNLFIITLLTYYNATCQDTIHLSKKYHPGQNGQGTVVTDRPPQAVYGELYGRALIYSINYDSRFQKKLTGMGFSAGVGALAVDGQSFVAIPFSINNLSGAHGHYFESGAGVTFVNANVLTFDDVSPDNKSRLLATLTLGYRSQPVTSGLNFRAGLNFIAGSGVFIPYPYVSLGFSF